MRAINGVVSISISGLHVESQANEKSRGSGFDVVVAVQVDHADAVASKEAQVAELELKAEGNGDVETVVDAVVAVHWIVGFRSAGAAKDCGGCGDVGVAVDSIAEGGTCEGCQFGFTAER